MIFLYDLIRPLNQAVLSQTNPLFTCRERGADVVDNEVIGTYVLEFTNLDCDLIPEPFAIL